MGFTCHYCHRDFTESFKLRKHWKKNKECNTKVGYALGMEYRGKFLFNSLKPVVWAFVRPFVRQNHLWARRALQPSAGARKKAPVGGLNFLVYRYSYIWTFHPNINNTVEIWRNLNDIDQLKPVLNEMICILSYSFYFNQHSITEFQRCWGCKDANHHKVKQQ